MSGIPKRLRNGATGYPYSARDHGQKWLMPDGSVYFTGWYEPGDTASIDRNIEIYEKRIREALDEIYTLRMLRKALENEA